MGTWVPAPEAGTGCPGRSYAVFQPLAPHCLWMQGDWTWFCSPHVPSVRQTWNWSCLYCSSLDAQGRPQVINTASSSTAPSCPSPDRSKQKGLVTCSLPPPISFHYPLLCAAVLAVRGLPEGSWVYGTAGSSFGRVSCACALRDRSGHEP